MGTALITGATSGIGLELAWQLAEAHHDLVLVARSRESLTAVAEQLCQVAGVGVEVLPADLSTSEGLTAVAERLRLEPTVARATSSSEHARVGDVAARPIDLLVNNAGFAVGQVFVGGDLRQERRALAVMVSAVMELTHAALPGMVARGHGAILNISSVTALTAMGTYAAHKAWVRTFTEGLAASLKGTGVNATVVCPGLVHTEFHEKVDVDPGQWPESAFIPAERVAAEAIEGVRRGKVVVTPSRRYRALAGALKVAPRSLVRAVAGPERSGRRG